MKSMTGYGQGIAETAGTRIRVEVRTVNQRHSEISIRSSLKLWAVEEKINKQVRNKVLRGKVDLSIVPESLPDPMQTPKVEWKLFEEYMEVTNEMRQRMGKAEPVSMDLLFHAPGVVSLAEDRPDMEPLWEVVSNALEESLNQLIAARTREGEKLHQHLAGLLQDMRGHHATIEKMLPELLEKHKQRLLDNVENFSQTVPCDPVRLAQETAFLFNKLDVGEEMQRLKTHFGALESAMKQDGLIGKRMDFLLQEMHREITTFSNKINHAELSQVAVEVKVILEKMREQVQNVE